MCNCGKKRNSYTQQQYATAIAGNVAAPVQNNPPVNFQYTGKTALSVTGSISGRRYRFNFTGEVQPVDARDTGAMMAIPVLKKFKDAIPVLQASS